MRLLVRVLLLMLVLASAWAQAPKAFEVASIRPAELLNKIVEYSVAGPNVTLEVYPVKFLLLEAYELEFDQVILSPSLERIVPGLYTIQAKAPGTGTPTLEEVREMLRELLASRFGLKFHRETRETQVYALKTAKGGSKLKTSAPDTQPRDTVTSSNRLEKLQAAQITMEDLARALRRFVDRPVVDRTGLTGRYDIEVEATPARFADDPQLGDVRIFSAIQESLGLQLEGERVQMPVLVVDAITPPTEN